MKKTNYSKSVKRRSYQMKPTRSSTIRSAYYSHLAYRKEAISASGIEDTLLATTCSPKLSTYGLEANSLIDGWWYTGIDEERFDQLVDTFCNPSIGTAGRM